MSTKNVKEGARNEVKEEKKDQVKEEGKEEGRNQSNMEDEKLKDAQGAEDFAAPDGGEKLKAKEEKRSVHDVCAREAKRDSHGRDHRSTLNNFALTRSMTKLDRLDVISKPSFRFQLEDARMKFKNANTSDHDKKDQDGSEMLES
eukprot:752325-Hanusia_phi.AAC.1